MTAPLQIGLPALAIAAAGAAILAGTAVYAIAALARERERRAAIDVALASRVTELAILHAIGREILATVDPERIAVIVERECRKLFDVDALFIGLLDKSTREIRIVQRGASLSPLADAVASWVVREKRGLRLDDATVDDAGIPLRPHAEAAGIRSILAAPLLVGERVVGVLSVQSPRAAAYDDHFLTVFSTVAQQAAVALENARHDVSSRLDSLTGLHLRDYFFRRFHEEYTRAKRYAGSFSILMLDIDGFKEINDRHGHLAGDRFLRSAGASVTSILRGADLACRYGGDEFCILLPETDAAGARTMAERLRVALAGMVVDVDGASLRTTVSIGIASHPEHDTGEIKGLLLRADHALYQAKRSGRDRVVPFAA